MKLTASRRRETFSEYYCFLSGRVFFFSKTIYTSCALYSNTTLSYRDGGNKRFSFSYARNSFSIRALNVKCNRKTKRPEDPPNKGRFSLPLFLVPSLNQVITP